MRILTRKKYFTLYNRAIKDTFYIIIFRNMLSAKKKKNIMSLTLCEQKILVTLPHP